MKNLFRNYFSSLPWGMRLFLLIFVFGFPVAWIGHRTQLFDLYGWLALTPTLVWKGQVWRMVTYAFLPISPLDWVISLFWLATLVSVLGRNWSTRGFWGYCLLGALAGGLFISLLKPGMPCRVVGEGAMIFALLVAWDWFYRNERLILLGIGEISVSPGGDFDHHHQLTHPVLLLRLVPDAGDVVRRPGRMALARDSRETFPG